MVDVSGRRLDAGLPGRQGRLLFAYLVLNRTRGCPRDELIDVLWPEGPPTAADSALSALLSKLRRALGEGVLRGRSELRLHLEDARVDIEASAAAILDAEAAMEAGDHAAAAQRARDALSTDLQTFLPDAEGGWAAEQRRELETIRLRALETLAEAGLRQGGRELGAAEQAARSAIAAAPFRESSHRLLMEIHEAAGNPAEALRAFEELRLMLRDELGTVPGPSVMAVYERLLRGDQPPDGAPPDLGASRAPLPPPLAAATARHPFVGREDGLAALRESWRAALGEDRRLVLLAGEAGIGKSRLAAEFTRAAHGEGAVVLYGRFDEIGPGAYQPVLEMLRGWSGGAPLTAPAQRLGPRASDLAGLLPELGPPAAPPSPLQGDAATARQRLFDALAALIGEIAGGAPLLMVVDDLHWADGPTLQLLRHLVRAPQLERAMFLGTYRDGELGEGHPLPELIASLRRDGTVAHIALDGLGRGEVGALMEALGAASSSAFVSALHGQTEGNPFYIEEVVRHLRE